MKTIFLLDMQKSEFDSLMNLMSVKPIILDTTKNKTEEEEYNEIKYFIDLFLNSDTGEIKNASIMIVRFSGRERIAREAGDQCKETIITLSTKKRSIYYTSELKDVFIKAIETVVQEK